MTAVAMTIAGSDPSGGAGIQADLKTFHQHGVFGTSVISLLTVQNTQSVSAVEILDREFVLAQLDGVLNDIPPAAGKTGALGNVANIVSIAQRARSFAFPLIVDPVMISKHGQPLIDDDAVDALANELLPCAFLVTPNLFEATRLTGIEIKDVASMNRAAAKIAALGATHVLIKGGPFDGGSTDLLWSNGAAQMIAGERVETKHTHGTGCVLSAAITARLARGESLTTAVHDAKRFITNAIKTNPGLGRGSGPVNMHADV